MKRSLLAAAVLAVAATAALPALADGGRDHGWFRGGHGSEAEACEGGHGRGGMFGMMHGGRGGPMMGHGGFGFGAFDEARAALDADGDGTVTPEELRTGLAGELATWDADKDGTLSLGEFEALHTARIREMMVDRFQALDADGDGQVTSDEFAAPAERMERMKSRMAAHAEDEGSCRGRDGHGWMPGAGRDGN